MSDDDIEYVTLSRPKPPRVSVQINGIVIDDAAIAEERHSHEDEADPLAAATRALAIRELLRQRAVALRLLADNAAQAPTANDFTKAMIADHVRIATESPGVDGTVLEDDVLDAMLDRELTVPEPTPDDCRRYYDTHRGRFSRNDIVYASHILFAVTARAPLALIRHKAEETLALAMGAPDTFGELARERSNCPSSGVGGSLGQLLRGDSVPEFERALFDTRETGILPRLVNTRYGFHIVRIDRRVDGEPAPFDAVQADIARFLETRVRHKAMQQYIAILASQAKIEGVDLGEASGPLVQ